MKRKCLLPFWRLVLLSNLVTVACDPVHRKAFSVAIPGVDDPSGSNVQLMTEALSAIDEIAKKNGMKEISYNQPLAPGSTGRIYSIETAPRSGVTLKVVAHYKKKEIEIMLADFFKFSQSEVSKRIQDDLISTMKDRYGEDSIRRD